ncbi:tRNA methyltransferase tyw3 [Tyrophagus putrescentiae]|nr:tRNA methyltransferase tyw3 [Tyrophagus putrescentiae]
MYNYRPAKRGHQQQQQQQPGKQFANEKRQALVQKLDRSRKGELDELVQPLCDLINADARFYTTSSCSGRLTLCGLKKKEDKDEEEEEEEKVFEEDEKKKEKNSSFCSLFDRHKAGHYGQTIISSLQNAMFDTPSYEAVDLKFEPVIFHVRAVDLEAATALLQVAIQAGFRNSGIVTSAAGGATEHSSCIVALRHTLQMAVPVVVRGVVVTPEEYIHELVNVANGKFAANEAAIARLEADIRAKLYTAPLPNEPQANDGKEQQADQQVDALKEEEDGRPADQVPADDERTEEREEAVCEVEHRSGAMRQPHVPLGKGQNGGPHCGEAGA